MTDCSICGQPTHDPGSPPLCSECQDRIGAGTWTQAREGRELVVRAGQQEILRATVTTEADIQQAGDYARQVEEAGERVVQTLPACTTDQIVEIWHATRALDRASMLIKLAAVRTLFERAGHIDSWSLRVNAVAETLGCRRTTVADCLQVTDTFGAELERLEDYPEMHWSHVIRAARHPKALGGPAAAVQVFAQHLHGGHKPSVREYEAALRGNKPQAECQFRVFYCSKYQKVLESDRVCEDCPVMKGR